MSDFTGDSDPLGVDDDREDNLDFVKVEGNGGGVGARTTIITFYRKNFRIIEFLYTNRFDLHLFLRLKFDEIFAIAIYSLVLYEQTLLQLIQMAIVRKKYLD